MDDLLNQFLEQVCDSQIVHFTSSLSAFLCKFLPVLMRLDVYDYVLVIVAWG